MNVTDRRTDDRKKLPVGFLVELMPQEEAEAPALIGRAENLTMGGLGVVLEQPIDPALYYEPWVVAFTLPDGSGKDATLILNSIIAHWRACDGGYYYGLRFHELSDPAKSAERTALRQFLLSDLRESWQGFKVSGDAGAKQPGPAGAAGK